jgi:hypothetical protein
MNDFNGAAWRTSTRSNNGGACVEVAATPDMVGVRDSKDRTGPVLVFGTAEWRAFLTGVKTGALDI